MERAAAEANTGVGDVGICPGCTVLPIKAGAEALDRTDRVAQAIYFALANHVSVLDLLTAELGYSQETAAALNLAWKRGMVVIGASNDFDSEDHQEGMFWPHVWPGNGLVPDGQGTIPSLLKTDRLTTEFRSRSNETSFGPHALCSAPSEGGSTSESQPTQAAVAALVVSEGRDASDRHLISAPLSAGEVEQVLRATASPIDDPTGDWPGQPLGGLDVERLGGSFLWLTGESAFDRHRRHQRLTHEAVGGLLRIPHDHDQNPHPRSAPLRDRPAPPAGRPGDGRPRLSPDTDLRSRLPRNES
jgi:subtilisin family serine protease